MAEGTTGGSLTLPANSVAARLVVAMMGTAGILYANVGPVIVSGLAMSGAFDSESAGYVFAANMYGSAVGGFAVIFLVERPPWKPAAAGLLAATIAIDLLSASDGADGMLLWLRFAHGVFAGALIGISMSVIARMASPERTFAFLILIQLSLGGVGIAALTPLLERVGVGAVWLSLAVFSLLALLLLPLLGEYPAPAPRGSGPAVGRAPVAAILLALLALFAYQAGEMAAFAYMLELGAYYGFDAAFMSLAVALSLWIGAPATLLVAWWSTRSGRLRPLLLGGAGTTLVVALLLVPAPAAFAVANVGFGIFFAITIPYLLGLVSEMDNGGRMAAVGGFANSLGLATGPALAAALVGGGELTRAPLLGAVLLALSLALALAPARTLDRASPHGRVEW